MYVCRGICTHTHTHLLAHSHVCCFRCFIAVKYVIYFILWLLPLALLTLFVDALLHNEEISSRLFMSSFFSFRYVVPLSLLLTLALLPAPSPSLYLFLLFLRLANGLFIIISRLSRCH